MQVASSFSDFCRMSVADQAAAALRAAIQRGTWSNFIPGEHELARHLGIGRSSIRVALAQLTGEGLITISNGRPARVRSTYRSSQTPSPPPTVCILTSKSREEISPSEHPALLNMQAEFRKRGIGWEEMYDSKLGGPHPERRLKLLVGRRQAVCWVLMAASAAVQRWFESAKVPVVAMGSCNPGIALPSVDVDYRAIGWHIAGRFAEHGHKHLALVLPKRMLGAGDLACRDGFFDYVNSRGGRISAMEIGAGYHSEELHRKVRRLMASNPRPTAIFTTGPANALTVAFGLMQRGLRIPDDVSLASGTNHSLLDQGMPELTRYHSHATKVSICIVKLVQSLFAGRPVAPKAHFIVPSFISGATLGRPPSGVQGV